jgi:shikimate dehydrogenase
VAATGPAGQAHRAAVLGHPVDHSLSPVIHNAGYAAAGLTGWQYLRFDCDEQSLAGFVEDLGTDYAGLSLTMPLKQVALSVADHSTPLAAQLGAANTLVRQPDGRWLADNTDAPGAADALRAAGVATAASVALLGAGGTARAALAAAAALGVPAVQCYARRSADHLNALAGALGLRFVLRPWAEAGEAGQSELVFATVPAGASDELAPGMRWRPGGTLLEAVYHPWPTPLAAAALAAGWAVVSGLDLLLAQAVRQFELFTGVPAPVAAMDAALRAAAAV